METSIPLSTFDSAYESAAPPWMIGAAQPAVVALERAGRIHGSVLDPGCGSGENAIHLAELGYDVLGLDFSQLAIDIARANAAERGVGVPFEVGDALRLGAQPRFDTVVDSALFHLLGPDDRAAYARGLHAACRPGALVHVLAIADLEPDFTFGPAVSADAIREAFGAGWQVEDLSTSRYRGMIDETAGARFTLPAGEPADMIAWLARLRRE